MSERASESVRTAILWAETVGACVVVGADFGYAIAGVEGAIIGAACGGVVGVGLVIRYRRGLFPELA